MKNCTCCHIEKEESEFSVQSRIQKKTGIRLYNLYCYCKACVRIKSKGYRDSYSKEEWERQAKAKQDWHYANYVSRAGTGTTEKQRIKNREQYYKNPKKSHHSCKIRKRKYRQDLSPVYVKSVICQHLDLKADEIPQQLIELKTKQLKSCRTLKELRNLSKSR